ncbi:hypothetical protein BDZ97DRAFT_1918674 [Flammula alnicola]|nr:hypothetical protein BDZ97DRAFT_1918674 [Flammula alnicola]
MCDLPDAVRLEAARLHNNGGAKAILANAAQHVGQTTNICLAAADFEHDIKAKKRALRKTLEHIPDSVRLRKDTIDLKKKSSAADSCILLAPVLETIPLSVELRLALAWLETHERAKAVLSEARGALPTSHELWTDTAHLLE